MLLLGLKLVEKGCFCSSMVDTQCSNNENYSVSRCSHLRCSALVLPALRSNGVPSAIHTVSAAQWTTIPSPFLLLLYYYMVPFPRSYTLVTLK